MKAPATSTRTRPARPSKARGFILYEGPSKLDGSPIVAIATLKTTNVKTGPMVQTWILRADIHPVEASATLQDASVCGSCPHRHGLGGACYVNIGQAPAAVWKAYKRGAYCRGLVKALQALAGRMVRFGAYGDPAAVPFEVWASVADVAAGHTGYTHQAAHPRFDARILQLCMVSADTPKAAKRHHATGARTFRVKTPEAPMLAGEVECLSDSQGITCAECGLCSGQGHAPSVVINVHGSRAGRYSAKYSRANLIAVA